MMKIALKFTYLLAALLITACKKDGLDTGPVKADFSAEKQEIVAGGTVTFTDISTGMPSRLHWTFEGGSPDTSILSSPEIQYEQPGTYRVTLRAMRGSQSQETVKESYITVGYGVLTADFSTESTTVYLDEEVRFQNLTSGVATSWEWVFTSDTDRKQSTEQHPVITFDQPGVYTVTLRSVNPSFEGTETKEQYLTVLDPADIEPNFTVQSSLIPINYGVQFTNTSMGMVENFNWEFEGAVNSISTEENPVVQYAAAGTYRVKLTVSNPYTSKSIIKERMVRVIDNSSLVLLIPFDQETTDLSANSLPVRNQGNLPAFGGQDRHGEAGRIATFNGSGGLVIPDHDALNFGQSDYSISVWIKSAAGDRMMAWQESGKNGPNDNQSWLRLNDNATDRRMRFNTEDTTGGFIVNADRNVTNGQWNHVVCVRRGNRSLIYVNGVVVREGTTATVKTVSNAGDFKIALQETATGFNNFFKGDLDDLVVYRKALTEAEIKFLYDL
ncbi:PKD domain-containing protein [Sphingobacterium olei]|uniref:PKD domain-containing protein n=1 Tax=Sphingobacterium olei TaxID=2571155 RepID=A0A4U0P087_9SPHI|nr:PKD domain-containing protein [Sphingobacterium olei]TJZ59912.1 PKD domain-containing protein [Sphingobacterium olei]